MRAPRKFRVVSIVSVIVFEVNFAAEQKQVL